jgi:hypothetical protein
LGPGLNVTKRFTALFYEFLRLARLFAAGRHFQPSLTFVCMPTQVNYSIDVPPYGWLQAIPTNIRQGWKNPPRTNALAYYEYSQYTKEKVS